MAEQNSDNLENNYYSLEKQCKDLNDLVVLRKFVKLIKDQWNISLNMKQHALNSFLIAGKYENVYQLKNRIKKKLKKVKNLQVSVEKTIKSHLKDYYIPRKIFNRTFKESKKFKYGTLNIGGLGPTKYGEYCIVIKRKQSEEYSSIAFVKEDSLNNYVDESQVNIKELAQDIANRECVHFLAALKHVKDIQRILFGKGPCTICCDDCYIEAIIKDDIRNTHIKSVRMSKKDYDMYYNYLYEDFISSKELDDFQRYRLYAFVEMQELLDTQTIDLEVITE